MLTGYTFASSKIKLGALIQPFKNISADPIEPEKIVILSKYHKNTAF